MKYFFSYSRSVKGQLSSIIELLRAVDEEVWWDADIPESADWWATILARIEWCEMFVFVVSEKSVASPYCMAELHYATARNRPILPFIIDDHTRYRIPPEVTPRREQWFLHDGNAAHLLKRLKDASSNIKWEQYKDIIASRPVEPNSGLESLTKTFHQAAGLARDGHFAEAIKRFRSIASLDFSTWGAECQEWVARLQLYSQIVELAQDQSTFKRARQMWSDYCSTFGDDFDPNNLNTQLVEPTHVADLASAEAVKSEGNRPQNSMLIKVLGKFGDQKKDRINEISIALYGPSGAGKTALSFAFHYAISHLENEISGLEVKFPDGSDPYEIPERPTPTARTYRRKLSIKREWNAPTGAQKVSTFTNTIKIMDSPGDFFRVAADSNTHSRRDLNESDDWRIQILWDQLAYDANIIVVLDPTLLNASNPHDANMSEQELKMTFNEGQYASMVHRLLRLPRTILGGHPLEVSRKVAICILKADQLPRMKTERPLTEVIKQLFGWNIHSAIGSLIQHFGDENVKTFVCSALGFSKKDTSANYDSQTGWIRDRDNWYPDGVIDPFLWIIQQSEIECLRRETKRSLIQGRLLSEKLKLYIPYLKL